MNQMLLVIPCNDIVVNWYTCETSLPTQHTTTLSSAAVWAETKLKSFKFHNPVLNITAQNTPSHQYITQNQSEEHVLSLLPSLTLRGPVRWWWGSCKVVCWREWWRRPKACRTCIGHVMVMWWPLTSGRIANVRTPTLSHQSSNETDYAHLSWILWGCTN